MGQVYTTSINSVIPSGGGVEYTSLQDNYSGKIQQALPALIYDGDQKWVTDYYISGEGPDGMQDWYLFAAPVVGRPNENYCVYSLGPYDDGIKVGVLENPYRVGDYSDYITDVSDQYSVTQYSGTYYIEEIMRDSVVEDTEAYFGCWDRYLNTYNHSGFNYTYNNCTLLQSNIHLGTKDLWKHPYKYAALAKNVGSTGPLYFDNAFAIYPSYMDEYNNAHVLIVEVHGPVVNVTDEWGNNYDTFSAIPDDHIVLFDTPGSTTAKVYTLVSHGDWVECILSTTHQATMKEDGNVIVDIISLVPGSNKTSNLYIGHATEKAGAKDKLSIGVSNVAKEKEKGYIGVANKAKEFDGYIPVSVSVPTSSLDSSNLYFFQRYSGTTTLAQPGTYIIYAIGSGGENGSNATGSTYGVIGQKEHEVWNDDRTDSWYEMEDIYGYTDTIFYGGIGTCGKFAQSTYYITTPTVCTFTVGPTNNSSSTSGVSSRTTVTVGNKTHYAEGGLRGNNATGYMGGGTDGAHISGYTSKGAINTNLTYTTQNVGCNAYFGGGGVTKGGVFIFGPFV